ncbi:L,D-transpeptidase family protein [Agrilutibacter solisilvae]|uniref:L,D-transpeptidase family protein n=1 Tax=Agrilutibacter solisilvae TaxID=2763317 RepID=A0A974XX18_9GAMM|nr:L,D-transpeptidase family protein [Lysobacter solisilvae]QSX77412.1 L,D-transpeptidase family protein [Lysobacter solisilvae]
MRLLAILLLSTAAITASAWVPAKKATFVYVDKSARELFLFNGTQLIAKYKVALGRSPVGHKQREGDKRTPEGAYVLDYKNPNSQYHRSIHISYPSRRDQALARRKGVPPGGAIMIHGQPNGFGRGAPILQQSDWTDGCIALTDEQMDAVWDMVDVPVRILIAP